MAKLVIGLKNTWVIRLLVFKFLIVWALHPAFWYLASLVGLPTWRGKFLPIFYSKYHPFGKFLTRSRSHWFPCRLMKAQAAGDTSSLDFMRGRRVFEINPGHPIIRNLNVLWTKRKPTTCIHEHTHTHHMSSYATSIISFNIILQAACKSNPNDEDAQKAIDLLYDAALVSSGYTVSIPFFSLVVLRGYSIFFSLIGCASI